MKLNLPIFLVMSFLSGLFEVGSILWMLGHASVVSAPFLAALSYQLGAAATSARVGRFGRTALAILTAFSAVLIFWRADLVCMTVATFFASALINTARMDLGKSEISTTAKRISRVTGFLVAPAFLLAWFAPVAFAAAAIFGSAGFLVSSQVHSRALPTRAGAQKYTPIRLALIVHQMHYFTYATVIIVSLFASHSAAQTVLLFTLGWVSYIATPHLIGHRQEPMSVALVGHLCLPLILLGMWAVPQGGIVWIILWVATGLFGGTVVYLTSYARKSFSVPEPELTALENWGHCLGSVVALVLVAIGFSAVDLLPIAAIFAGATAMLICVSSRAAKYFSTSSRRISL